MSRTGKALSRCTIAVYSIKSYIRKCVLILSTVSELILEQYIHARMEHCLEQLCITCTGMLQVAQTVLNHGPYPMPSKLLVIMPHTMQNSLEELLAISVGQPESG